LFRIRATAGKKDRLGPGLAIARQTMLDGGGERTAAVEPGRLFPPAPFARLRQKVSTIFLQLLHSCPDSGFYRDFRRAKQSPAEKEKIK